MKILPQSKPSINAEPLKVPIVDKYSEELQQVHPEIKPIKKHNKEKIWQLHQEKGKSPKIEIWKIKADTPEAQPRVIPETQMLITG